MKSFHQFMLENIPPGATYITHPRMNQAPHARPDWVPPRFRQDSPEVAIYHAARKEAGLDKVQDVPEIPFRANAPIGRHVSTRDVNLSEPEKTLSLAKEKEPILSGFPLFLQRSKIADEPITPKKDVQPTIHRSQAPGGRTDRIFYQRRYPNPGEPSVD